MTTDDRLLSGVSSESSLPPNKSSGDIGELKPCPWCGSTASRVRIMSRDAIQCDGENCGVIKRTPDEWNTRAPDPESAAEIERLRRENARLIANPSDQRYWEGRYRDEAARAELLEVDLGNAKFSNNLIDEEMGEWRARALTAESAVAAAWEEAAKIAEGEDILTHDPYEHAVAIAFGIRSRASAIRAAVSKKTAESGHSPSTHNSESE